MRIHNYIDIHTHILPGVDDGAKNMEETIAMLKMAYEEGILTIIATPHYTCGKGNVKVEELQEKKKQVEEEAKKIDKDFSIYLGNELFYSDGIINDLKSGKALTLADSRYVLVEFMPSAPYEKIRLAIHKFVLAGYAPIIAHMERYQCLYRKEELIEELIELGAYIQMNTGSLKGGFFNQEVSNNKKMVSLGLVHFFGSDCHNTGQRMPRMESTLENLRKKVDHELLDQILFHNPRKIIENKYV